LDCPNGLGCGLFLNVKTPGLFVIGDKRYEVTEKSYVFFTPDMAHHYEGLGGAFGCDWLYIAWDESDREKLRSMGITVNTPVRVINSEELSELVKKIAYEFHSPDPSHEDIVDCYFNILLYKLKDNNIAIKSVGEKGGAESSGTIPGNTRGLDRLLKVRGRIYSVPEDIPDIAEFADWCELSPSGFAHAYKKAFGVSVKSDIQNSRFEYAGYLLKSTTLQVGEISEKCGYASEFSFMRAFKQFYGVTPTEYRNKL